MSQEGGLGEFWRVWTVWRRAPGTRTGTPTPSHTQAELGVSHRLPLRGLRGFDWEEAAAGGRGLVRAAGGVGGVPGRRREEQQLLALQVEAGWADEGTAVTQGTGAGGHGAGHGGRRGRERGCGAAGGQQGEVV